MFKKNIKILHTYTITQLVVSTHLKNISQIGSFPQVGMKIDNTWNHHLVIQSRSSLIMFPTSYYYCHLIKFFKLLWFFVFPSSTKQFRRVMLGVSFGVPKYTTPPKIHMEPEHHLFEKKTSELNDQTSMNFSPAYPWATKWRGILACRSRISPIFSANNQGELVTDSCISISWFLKTSPQVLTQTRTESQSVGTCRFEHAALHPRKCDRRYRSHSPLFWKKTWARKQNKTTVEVIHPSGQIPMIPKTELRAVWEDSLT